MKNLRLFLTIGASAISLVTGLLPVNAQTYNGASTYRDTDTIYQVGVTPSSSVPVIYNSTTISKTSYSDACGILKISLGANPPSTLTINGTAFTVNSAPELSPTTAKYKCTSGVPTYTGFTNSTGSFRLARYSDGDPVSTTLYISSSAITGGANKASLISYTGIVKKDIKANGCGFVAIKAPSRGTFISTSAITIGGAAVTFGSIPQTPNPPVCKDDTTYVASTAATTYNGSALYRTAKSIYYTGLTPNSLNSVELNGLASKSISYYKGDPQMYGYVPLAACGVFHIDFGKKRVPSLKIGSTDHTVATVPANTNLGCSAANLAALTPNTLYRIDTPFNGAASRFIYRVSDIAIKTLKVEYPSVVTRNLAVNSCGFAKIDSLNAVNGFNATDKVNINGTEYTVSTLPLAPKAPICKNGVTYQAAS